MAFEIGVNTKVAQGQVEALAAKIDRLAMASDRAAAKLQASMGTMDSRQLRNIQASINGVTSQLTNMNSQWVKTYEAHTAANKGIKTGTTVINKYTKGAKGATRASDDLSGGLLTVSQRAALLRSSMLALGTHVGIFTARTLVAATAAYGTVKAIKGVIEVGSSYTKSLAETAAIIGTQREALGDLSNDMLHLAEVTKFTTTEVADAASILAKTGMKTETVSRSLRPVLNLAAIGSMDMAKAADIAANSMFGFQLETHDLERVVDMLAFTATNSNTSVQQLGVAMSYAAPVAAATGAKFEEVAAMMGVMADSGVKASRAGTTIRRVYSNLLEPSEAVKQIFSDLGVELRDNEGQMRSMVDILRDLAAAGANVADIKEIAGVRAAPGVIAVWKDLAKGIEFTDSKLEDLLDRFEKDGKGSADLMRETMEQNLPDAWKKFQSAVSVQATEAFGIIEESLMNLVEGMTVFVRETVEVRKAFETISVYGGEVKTLLGQIAEGYRFLAFATGADRGLSLVFAEWMDYLQLLKTAILDLPINIDTMAKLIGIRLGQSGEQFKSLWIKIKRANDQMDYLTDSVLKFGDAQLELDRQHGLKMQEYAEQLETSRKLQEEQAELADEMIADVLRERDARLKNRDAMLAEVEMLQRAREMAAAERRQMTGELPDRREVGMGRVPPEGPGEDWIKNQNKDLKTLIKTQQDSVKVTLEQIGHFEKLGTISPYEALNASIEATQNQRAALVSEFKTLETQFLEWEKTFRDAQFGGVADEFAEGLKKVREIHRAEMADLDLAIQKWQQALSLAERYVLVQSERGARVVAQPGDMTGGDALSALTDLREEYFENDRSMIAKNEQEKLLILEEAWRMKVEVENAAHEQSLMSKQEYEDLATEIKRRAELERLDLTADYYKKEADLQRSASMAKAQAVASGFAAYTAEGARSSKKLFQINKNASMAQVMLDTPAAVAGAYKHGAVLGGPILGAVFAGMAFANQMAQLQAIKSTTFGGGGSVSAPSATSTATTATSPIPPPPPMSDALFEQTTTPTTTDSMSATTEGDTIIFDWKIDAVDGASVANMLESRKTQIISMIQSAYTERGKTGGPVR